jgi:hypothetical protein
MGVDPVSLALIGMGVAGTATSAFGSYESGQATKANDQYQAIVAQNNALIAKQNAAWDIQSGDTAATNQGLRTRAQVGTQKASQGAAGVDVNTGSAPTVRAGTEAMGMLDAMTIRSNAAKQAYSAQVQASNDTAQSQLDTSAGEQAGIAGDIGAAGGLLSGVSSAGLKYAAFQQSSGSPQSPGAGSSPAVAPGALPDWSSIPAPAF